jgi:hypothetical protein
MRRCLLSCLGFSFVGCFSHSYPSRPLPSGPCFQITSRGRGRLHFWKNGSELVATDEELVGELSEAPPAADEARLWRRRSGQAAVTFWTGVALATLGIVATTVAISRSSPTSNSTALEVTGASLLGAAMIAPAIVVPLARNGRDHLDRAVERYNERVTQTGCHD